MSLNKNQTHYRTLDDMLTQHHIGMTAAELHGLISGILCGGDQDSSWRTLTYELINEGQALPQKLSQALQQLYEQTKTDLEQQEFSFHLLIPDGANVSVFIRAEALCGWVNHFLLGLGVTQPKLDKVTEEAGEAIDDLRTIAQLGYDEEDNEQELEQALEEVLEYVKVAALICYEQFGRQTRAQPASVSPVLH